MMASSLETLPIELFESIIVQLDSHGLQQLRLSSLTLAVATRPYLAQPTFYGYPWRDDVQRLYELTRLAPCAERIRSVCLNFARMDEYRAFHDSFSFFYLIDPELRGERLNLEWSTYYAGRRHAATLGESRAEARLVRPALAELSNLKSLRLTWRENPWEGPEMERVFRPDESMNLATKREIVIQFYVLRWLWSSDTPLEHLEIDALSIPERELRKFVVKSTPGKAVEVLKTFKVHVRSREEERAAMHRAVRRMAGNMPQLEMFELDGEVVSEPRVVDARTDGSIPEAGAI